MKASPPFFFISLPFVLFYEIRQESNEFLFHAGCGNRRYPFVSYSFCHDFIGLFSFNLCFLHLTLCSFYFLSSVHTVWVGFFLVWLCISFDLNLAEFLFSVCISMDWSSCFSHIFLHFLCLHVRCDLNMDCPLGGFVGKVFGMGCEVLSSDLYKYHKLMRRKK